ncbi:hypothetical protein EUX98_g8326 [Antrodiella citrinella]|uniref:Uncharacterized protein n=1 Tax=Antrodiella citrinella TaxID=2447956 RepID=A0A4S4M8Z4_9APHY|nr:hypothetical protein EUX98_g8326 [Antrodiella citrinella]
MAGIPFDMIGFVTSILGIFGLVPLVWVIVMYQLPQYKLKQLDAAIEETTTMLETAVQNGFVPGPKFVSLVEAHLRLLRDLTEDLRAKVVCAAGFRNQCVAAIGGLSRRIDITCRQVGLIRTRIAETSDQERRKAEERNHRNGLLITPFSAAQLEQDKISDDDEHLKYEDLETLDLIESLSPPLPPDLTIPPPMYSVHTAIVQYQPFRDRNSGTLGLDALSVQRRSSTPAPSSIMLSARALSTSSISPQLAKDYLPSRNQENAIAHGVTTTASGEADDRLPQACRDDIQAMLMEFKYQLLADQRDMIVSSMQNVFGGALERTILAPLRV